MKKTAIFIFFGLLISTIASCRCPMQIETVDRLEQSIRKQHEKYLKYVDADPKLSKEQKDIEHDNAKSQMDLIESIRKAHQ